MARKPPLKLAIIGTGNMAALHAQNFRRIPGCQIVAACDVDSDRASKFAKQHEIPAVFTSVEDLLNGPQFDASTIVVPDAFHAPIALACLKAGKHVLCEKPLATSHPDARKMAAAAISSGTINMVNFSYRDWPCIQAAARLISRGTIGEIRHVEASYLQAWLPSKIWGDWRSNPSWLWRLSSSHGSLGVLGDVGVHILDYATFPCGPIREVFCRLRAFPKAPRNRIGSYHLDANDSAIINVEFAGGALGTIHTSRWVGGHANRLALKISGTKGTVAMDSEISKTGFKICAGPDLDRCAWKDVEGRPVLTNYQKFIRAIRTGSPADPDFARGAEIQCLIDACFQSNLYGRPVVIPSRGL